MDDGVTTITKGRIEMSGPIYNAPEKICTSCYHIATPIKKRKVSYLLLFFLILLGVIPAFIYAIWVMSEDYSVCPKCGSKEIIPVDSARGAKILAEIGNSPVKPEAQPVPSQEIIQEPEDMARMVMDGVVFPVNPDPYCGTPVKDNGAPVKSGAAHAAIGLLVVSVFAVGALLISEARKSSANLAVPHEQKAESTPDTGVWHQMKPLYILANEVCVKLDDGYPSVTWGIESGRPKITLGDDQGDGQKVDITENIVNGGAALDVSGKYPDGTSAIFRLYKSEADCPVPMAKQEPVSEIASDEGDQSLVSESNGVCSSSELLREGGFNHPLGLADIKTKADFKKVYAEYGPKCNQFGCDARVTGSCPYGTGCEIAVIRDNGTQYSFKYKYGVLDENEVILQFSRAWGKNYVRTFHSPVSDDATWTIPGGCRVTLFTMSGVDVYGKPFSNIIAIFSDASYGKHE